jgi:hypothetical protein
MTQSNKFEQLLELLINEENDKAQALFHEIVVEKSRDIYEGLVDSETAVEEAKEESKEESKEEETNEEVELEEKVEDTNEAESIEEIGGDATDDLIADISADEKGDAEMGGEEDESGEEGDTEERVADLEDALDELKAEFEKMMNGDKEEGDEEEKSEESLDAMEPAQDAQAQISAEQTVESKEVVKEYKIQKSADNGDKADNKHSPVKDAGNKLPKGGDNIAKGSAEEKGRPAPTAEKIIGDVANTGGKSTVSLKAAPKAETADKADNKKSPVATK